LWDMLSLALVLALFALLLIHKWQTGFYEGVVIGGLLPSVDALEYYRGAQSLIMGGNVLEIATRRPIFAGFLAVLLFLTGNNLQFTLAALQALHAFAIYLTSREIQISHGPLTASIYLGICYWYYCAISGTTMTENLGVCFGSLGTALLLFGIRKGKARTLLFGLFLLTIALNIRAGAFLTALFGAARYLWKRRKALSDSKNLLVLFMDFNLLYLTLARNSIDLGENNRFRFVVDPFILVLFLFVIVSGVRSKHTMIEPALELIRRLARPLEKLSRRWISDCARSIGFGERAREFRQRFARMYIARPQTILARSFWRNSFKSFLEKGRASDSVALRYSFISCCAGISGYRPVNR